MILVDIIIFYLGALFSSFYILVANRLVHKETILGHSYCDHCKHELKLYDVIPIFGYLLNLGKCRYCEKKISIKYPILELFGGLIIMLSYQVYGLNFEFYVFVLLYSVFLITSLTDIKDMLVFDQVWIIALIPLIIIRIVEQTFFQYFISSAVMFTILFLIAYLGQKVYKKEALGGGDIKLYIFIGFVIPLLESLLSLMIASFTALLFVFVFKKMKDSYIPLVPFIFIGVVVSYLYGRELISWYLSLLGAWFYEIQSSI